MKTCITCGIEKEVQEFKKHRRTCTQCLKTEDAKRRQEDPAYLEECRAYHRDYYRDNAEHLREIQKASESKPEQKKKKAARYRQRRDARTPEEAAAVRAKRAEEARQRYLENPDEVNELRAQWMEKRLAKFNLLKMGRPCYDCGSLFPPEAMDWDHRPGVNKCFAVSTGVRNRSEDEVIDEINKCQLVCACCHRIRTQARMQKKDKEI